MPDSATPGVPQNASLGASQALTPALIAALLADFHHWLTALATQPAAFGPPQTPPAPDLFTLLGQMTALRHEVNLQTKAVRAQQETTATTLEGLESALHALERQTDSRDSEQAPSDSAVRPLLKTLIDLYDALSLAYREVERIRDINVPVLEDLADDNAAAAEQLEASARERSPWWRRWRARTDTGEFAAADSRRRHAANAARAAQALTSLSTGYAMGLQRIERAIKEHGLETIDAAGRPFDPETMEAIEAVSDADRRAGEVIEEVRPGYLWHGRVFRCALVRVAR